jgi:hypothetical protein
MPKYFPENKNDKPDISRQQVRREPVNLKSRYFHGTKIAQRKAPALQTLLYRVLDEARENPVFLSYHDQTAMQH